MVQEADSQSQSFSLIICQFVLSPCRFMSSSPSIAISNGLCWRLGVISEAVSQTSINHRWLSLPCYHKVLHYLLLNHLLTLTRCPGPFCLSIRKAKVAPNICPSVLLSLVSPLSSPLSSLLSCRPTELCAAYARVLKFF